MLQKYKEMVKAAKRYGQQHDIIHSDDFKKDRLLGELIRNCHSIEKGLSLREVRPGFGYKKIEQAVEQAKQLKDEEPLYREASKMLVEALKQYLAYHDKINYTDDKIEKIRQFTNELLVCTHVTESKTVMGGVITVTPARLSKQEQSLVESLFGSRHSVREFAKQPVPMNDICSAVKLAISCPSACNRQCYRVHIVENDSFAIFENWFEGIGGFTEEIDKLLLITGKMSVYRDTEHEQWIVSSSVFAGYLTLALQVYGVGCCFIQRPVVPTVEWDKVQKELNIAKDEQIICALGVGVLLNEYKVPVSHRFSIDEITTVH